MELLPTSGLLDWIDVLTEVDPEGERPREAKGVLRARLNLQGTTMGLSTEKRDWLWWLMVSPDGNAARAVLSVLNDREWRSDAPRMIRGLLGRQQRGRWQTTVANAWGTVAAQRFAEIFKAGPVTGTSLVGVGDAQRSVEWPNPQAHAESPAPVDVPWPAAQKLTLDHCGTGAPWGLVQLRVAVPRTEAVRAGYRIQRRVEPALRDNPDVWRRGDVARVEMTITGNADMTWVVVEDPIPPGATILGSGLGGDSYMLSREATETVGRCSPSATSRATGRTSTTYPRGHSPWVTAHATTLQVASASRRRAWKPCTCPRCSRRNRFPLIDPRLRPVAPKPSAATRLCDRCAGSRPPAARRLRSSHAVVPVVARA